MRNHTMLSHIETDDDVRN